MTRKIYIASSWSNDFVHEVADELREAGHYVFNFKEANKDFKIQKLENEIPSLGLHRKEDSYTATMHTKFHGLKRVEAAHEKDLGGLNGCDSLVLLLPAGNSSHIEFGIAKAAGVCLYVLMPSAGARLDLMYNGAVFVDSVEDLIKTIAQEDGATGDWDYYGAVVSKPVV